MERSEAIEIPFGAKDSELKGWEYTIPEGMEAEIKDGKIIVREKESEDERIRKWIKKELESKYVVDNIVNNVMADKALAWLEKQGEQKDSVVDFKAEDWYVSKIDGKIHNIYHSVDKVKPKFHEGDWLEKQGEQSQKVTYTHEVVTGNGNIKALVTEEIPANKVEPKFKVGDVIRNKWSNRTKTIIAIDNSQYILDDGMPAQPLKVNINAQDNWELVEQNPAYKIKISWGDKVVTDTEIEKVCNLPPGTITSLFASSQKQDCLKQSEEDEDVINHLLAICAGAKRYRQFAGCLQEDITKYQTWLKSLKERYTWKPSDEQMKQLGLVVELNKDTLIGEGLMTLFNDLKKLKG